jgi:hypothetical protein
MGGGSVRYSSLALLIWSMLSFEEQQYLKLLCQFNSTSGGRVSRRYRLCMMKSKMSSYFRGSSFRVPQLLWSALVIV